MNSHDDDTQFWSEPARRTGRMRRTDRDATGELRRTSHAGEFERTREHRVVRGRQVRETDATPIALSAFDYDLEDRYADLGRYQGADAKWAALDGDADPQIWVEPEERPRRAAGVDPRLVRLAAIAAAAVVMVPVALAAAASDNDGRIAAAPVAAEQPAAQSIVPSSTIPITAAVTNAVTTAGDNPADDDQQTAAAGSGAAEKPSAVAASQTTAEAAACAGQYTVVAGDYWLRFDGTGASVDAWLEANDASIDTNLFPGSELCIPAGAQAPAPPATTAPPATPAPTTQPAVTQPPATQAPATTQPPTTQPPATQAPATTQPRTTQAPATTQPPATTKPPATTPPTTRPPGSGGSVEQIIRNVWPDHLEERALVIARRESNLQPGVRNYCCFGLFQIYYDVHRSWLRSIGVDSAEDLYDPYLNTVAAYTLYQRSGGFGPWSQTDPG